MSVITDSFSMSITVIQHGIARIVLPVIFPATVEKDTPFVISYTIKNDGPVTDTLYGHLLVGINEIPGSAWTEPNVIPDATFTKTFNHPGIATNTTIILECGHN